MHQKMGISGQEFPEPPVTGKSPSDCLKSMQSLASFTIGSIISGQHHLIDRFISDDTKFAIVKPANNQSSLLLKGG